MGRHRAPHGAEADKTDIDHFNSPYAFSCSGIGRQRGVPTEAFNGRRPRLVFAPDPATITNSVEMTEQEGVVDLAGPRLVAAGVVGELDMGDVGQVLLQASGNITFHYLHVVDVVLHEQIARAYVRNELTRLLGPVQKEAGNVDGVDRLDQEPDPFLFQRTRGATQIFYAHT